MRTHDITLSISITVNVDEDFYSDMDESSEAAAGIAVARTKEFINKSEALGKLGIVNDIEVLDTDCTSDDTEDDQPDPDPPDPDEELRHRVTGR